MKRIVRSLWYLESFLYVDFEDQGCKKQNQIKVHTQLEMNPMQSHTK